VSQSLQLKNIPTEQEAATTMLYHRDGARFHSDVTLRIQAKEFRLENFIVGESFRQLMVNSKQGVMSLLQRCGF
jgi:hypothetical protein